MIRRHCLWTALCLAAAGCGHEQTGRSPFSGSGASDRRGVLAVAQLSRDLLSEDWFPELWGETIPDGVELIWVWLDAKAYGGSQAFLLRGREPEQIMRSLLQSGLLAATDRPDTYRLQIEDLLPSGFLELFLTGTLGGLAGSAPEGGPLLKRYDRGDRLALIPTVDLRGWMFDLAETLESSPEPIPPLALALDGRSLARMIREQIQPRLRFFFGLADAAAGAEADARGLKGAIFGVRLALEALTQLEGAVLSLADQPRLRLDVRLTALSETPLQLYFESFEPAPALPESNSPDGRAHLALALHPERFSRAVDLLADPVLDDMSPDYAEQFEIVQELTRTRFGGLLVAGQDTDGRAGLALSLKPGTTRADLAPLDRFWPADTPWRLEQGFWMIGDGQVHPVVGAGRSSFVGRIWGRAGFLGPGMHRGELRRIERGLWFQFDASMSD